MKIKHVMLSNAKVWCGKTNSIKLSVLDPSEVDPNSTQGVCKGCLRAIYPKHEPRGLIK